MQNLYSIWREHRLFGLFDSLYPKLPELNWPIFLLALLVPLLLIYARNEIRVRRLRSISDFIDHKHLPKR
jgi:hypothetical protein